MENVYISNCTTKLCSRMFLLLFLAHFYFLPMAFFRGRLEHSKRSQDSCGFLSLSKNFDDLTIEEYYELEMERVRTFLVSNRTDIRRAEVT